MNCLSGIQNAILKFKNFLKSFKNDRLNSLEIEYFA